MAALSALELEMNVCNATTLAASKCGETKSKMSEKTRDEIKLK